MKTCLLVAICAATAIGGLNASPATAAGDTSKTQRAKAHIVVSIDGITHGRVRVRGQGISKRVPTSASVGVPAGRYTLRALPVTRDGQRYLPTPRRTKVHVRPRRSPILSVTYVKQGQATGTVTSPSPGGELGAVYELLNDARTSGVQCGTTWMPAVPAVTYTDDLGLAAQRHAQDMADNDYFSHYSLDGRSFVDRIRATPYAGDPGGENIASGFRSAADVMQGWLNSPGHCTNLMNEDFDHVGLGLASRNDARYSVPVTYWVQEFGYRPASYKY